MKGKQSKAKKRSPQRQSGSPRSNYQDRFTKQESNKVGKDEAAKFPKQFLTPEVAKKDNDVSWYAKNQQILHDYANVSYFSPVGSPLRLDDIVELDTSTTNVEHLSALSATVPGIMTIELGLTPGVSVDHSSPINIAAQNVYNTMRKEISGQRVYDAPDYMMYILAMDSAYTYWNWMKRLYGLVRAVTQTNFYRMKSLVEANGVNYDSIAQNLADFRGYINVMAANLMVFAVPSTMSYLIRHSWLFSNVYKDANSRKAQYYMFVPSYVYTYDETSSSKGGVLRPLPIMFGRPKIQDAGVGDNPALWTLDQIISTGNIIVNNLHYSEDINTMSSDTMKVFGSGVFSLSPVNDDYLVEPVYSEEVLSQIENSLSFTFADANLDQFKITQDPNTNNILFRPIGVTGTAVQPMRGAVINMHKDNVTEGDTMVATRLIADWSQTGMDENTYNLRSCGSEVVLGTKILWYVPKGADIRTDVTYINLQAYQEIVYNRLQINTSLVGKASESSRDTNRLNIAVLAKLSNFDWHPQVWVDLSESNNPDDNQGNYYIMGQLLDYDMYALVSQTQIDNMNLGAMLSMFNIPYGSDF
nr:putative capsid [Marmot picobirnavirus]